MPPDAVPDDPSSASAEPQPIALMTENLFRHEGARLVALLVGQLGVHRLQLAEDVVQEALVRALQTWPYRGIPDNPAAWITQTAKNLVLDHLRREQRWQERQDGVAAEQERWLSSGNTETVPFDEGFEDNTLRLLFVCFHPQLSAEAQGALALRTLCGFSPAEIAAAYLTTEAAIAKRLVRARQRIRELGLSFEVPAPHELPERLDGVLGTLYLLFNEGYKASGGPRLVRTELCHEAIRLLLLLAHHPATRTPKVHALLALMLLNGARLEGRTDGAGNLLLLEAQDRSRWNQAMIHRGVQHLGMAATGPEISVYHLEAGIAACHSTAASAPETNWPRILSLYDQLLAVSRSPIAALNRAVAVAKVSGPAAGLQALADMPEAERLKDYHLYPAVRAAFLMELRRFPEAMADLERALLLTQVPSERQFLQRRLDACRHSPA